MNIAKRHAYAYKYLKGEWSHTIFSGAQCEGKRQWPQTGTQKVPSEHQEALLLLCWCWSTATSWPESLWSLPFCRPPKPTRATCSTCPCLRWDEHMSSRGSFQLKLFCGPLLYTQKYVISWQLPFSFRIKKMLQVDLSDAFMYYSAILLFSNRKE